MTEPAFKQVQQDFAAYIRDPENAAAPADIDERRMVVYRDLFYNNIEGFISSGFPVLRSLYDEKNWHTLIRGYFSQHRAHTPHFPEMAGEFVKYLKNAFTHDTDPPFLIELAHYEWMETALLLSKGSFSDVSFNAEGDLASGQVVISPLAWLLSYEWPVHQISKGFQPDVKPQQPTWVIIYRDRNDEVGFMHVNPVTARLFQLLDNGENELTGQQALEQVAQELGHKQPEVIIQGGLDTLRQLRKRDIILGVCIYD